MPQQPIVGENSLTEQAKILAKDLAREFPSGMILTDTDGNDHQVLGCVSHFYLKNNQPAVSVNMAIQSHTGTPDAEIPTTASPEICRSWTRGDETTKAKFEEAEYKAQYEQMSDLFAMAITDGSSAETKQAEDSDRF